MSAENPFETHYDEYDAWFDANENVYQAELLAIQAVLPQRTGDWIEVGVGSGRFACKLGIKTGIEPAAGIASLARKRGIEVIQGVAEELPLPDASVAAVFLITTLCFVQDMNRALREAARVLKPGGAAIVAFIPQDSPLGEVYAQLASRDRFLKHATLRTKAAVLGALAEAGLSVDRCVQTLTGDPGTANKRIEPPSAGCDRGSFVVVRALKPRD